MLASKQENTITTPHRTKQIVRVGCHHHAYSNEPLGRVGVHAGLTRQEMALPLALACSWRSQGKYCIVNFSSHLCSCFLPRLILLGVCRRARLSTLLINLRRCLLLLPYRRIHPRESAHQL